jgi:hypothetical protein
MRPNTSVEVEFSDDGGPAGLASACETEMATLVCCMSGFQSIGWYQQDASTGNWEDFDFDGKDG